MASWARVLVLASSAALVATGCGKYRPTNSTYDFGTTPDASFGGGGDAGPSLTTVGGYAGPTTCAQATSERSYIGCDYWPTVTTNPVWSIFDFTAVVANAQSVAATIHVTGPSGVDMTMSVAPGTLEKFYLPWVAALKGPDCDSCGRVPIFAESVTAPGAAYHLVSSVPVTVYEFNALEYKGVGGPAGKDWRLVPGQLGDLLAPRCGRLARLRRVLLLHQRRVVADPEHRHDGELPRRRRACGPGDRG